jgi:hypothetical protein
MDEDKYQKEIEELKQFIASAENSLESAKFELSKLTGEDYSRVPSNSTGGQSFRSGENGTVIEGLFNGENMVGPDGKIFPVPANYASKSKLIEGDRLKLTIAEDGSFIFKQIGPAERKKIIGTLNFEDNAYHVLAEGHAYNVLYASVTYFKAKPNDRVTIVVPISGESSWGALENVIGEINSAEPAADTTQTSEITMKPTELTETQVYGEGGSLSDAVAIAPEHDTLDSTNDLEV